MEKVDDKSQNEIDNNKNETTATRDANDGYEKYEILPASTTEISTENLICKTPNDSLDEFAVHSATKKVPVFDGSTVARPARTESIWGRNSLVYNGILQVFFGTAMVVFGVVAIVHSACLSRIYGGVWGGIIAIISGTIALGTEPNKCIPIRLDLVRMMVTMHLTFSLISLATTNLVLVLAAIGMFRDIHRTDIILLDIFRFTDTDTTYAEPVAVNNNWVAILANCGLVVVGFFQVLISAMSAWRGARIVCPCFHQGYMTENVYSTLNTSISARNPKEMLISDWLKQQEAMRPRSGPGSAATMPRIGSTMSRRNAPVYVISPAARPVKTLIPAPLHAMAAPNPICLSTCRMPVNYYAPPRYTRQPCQHHRRYRSYGESLRTNSLPYMRRVNEHTQTELTQEDVVRTYTGLDKVIAEDFINVCNSLRQHSMNERL